MTDELGERTIPVSKLEELVAEWREPNIEDAIDEYGAGYVGAQKDCADYLEEVIND